jgi:splicing factor 3B subunit 1
LHIPDAGLVDKQQKVRTLTALAVAALAETAIPCSVESFDSVLKLYGRASEHTEER